MSSHPLTKGEESVLSKGFNFAVAPKYIPIEQIISSIESSIKSLPKYKSDMIRSKTVKCLQSSKSPKSNISRAENTAIINLKTNSSITIMSDDKDTVITQRPQYRKTTAKI